MKTLRASLVLLGWGMTIAAAFPPRARADSTPVSDSASASASATDSASAPATASPPTATIGLAQVIRGNAPKSLGVALLAAQPAVDACYADAIAKEGDAAANVSLRLEIVPPGRVVSAVVASSEDASLTLRGCVRDAFAGLAAGAVSKQPIEVLLPVAFAREASSEITRPSSACPATWEDDGVEGELPDALRGALADRAVRAGFCFKRPAAPGEPSTLKKGTMEVHLRLAADGSVCGATAVGDEFDRPSLTSCVLETMSQPYDDKPIGAIDVVVPLAFKGS